jgi:hypothetical protein
MVHAEILFAVTAIRRVTNSTTQWLYVQNHENPNNGRAFCLLSPGETSDPHEVNMWIPHCANQGDFNNGKYIEIGTWNGTSPVPKRYLIWQHNRWGDGDHVRFSYRGIWHDEDGHWIPGQHSVDGDRRLTINAFNENGLRLDRL